MIEELEQAHVPHMLTLQQHCIDHGDPFTPTSERGYSLCYQYKNFALGVWNADRLELHAFLCCTIPTCRASRNFGRGRLRDDQLDAVGHMNTLLIRSEHRGQGLGKALMRAGIQRLSDGGARYVYAIVSPENIISAHMLDVLGFELLEHIDLNGVPKLLFYLAA